MDGITAAGYILASNTSSLAVIEMASSTRRPDKVIGLHFSTGARLPLLEMVRTFLTSEGPIRLRANSGGLGKKVVVSKDAPGFIVNALLIPYVLDAVRMFEKGFAAKEGFDLGIKLGLNHPWGRWSCWILLGWTPHVHRRRNVPGDQGHALCPRDLAAADGDGGLSRQEERQGFL